MLLVGSVEVLDELSVGEDGSVCIESTLTPLVAVSWPWAVYIGRLIVGWDRRRTI